MFVSGLVTGVDSSRTFAVENCPPVLFNAYVDWCCSVGRPVNWSQYLLMGFNCVGL